MAIISVMKRMKYSGTPSYGYLVNTATFLFRWNGRPYKLS